MTDREGLVAAIAARPADDTPRLVLADWLDEHGEPARAAFVRAACAAGRCPPGSPARADRLDRADDLLAAHEPAWLGEWRDRLIDWEYRRGVLWRVRLTAATFLRHGEELFRREPAGRVELVDDRNPNYDGSPGSLGPDAVREVVAHPAFRRVRECEVAGRWLAVPLDTWLSSLAANRRLTGLRRFGPEYTFGTSARGAGIVGDGLTEDALRAFCTAPHLRGLRSLDLSLEYARDGFVRPWLFPHLHAARFAPHLRRLRLRGCGLTAEDFRRLATGPAFVRLRELELEDNPIGERGAWAEVFDSPHLQTLTAVGLNANHLPAYARSALVKRVRRVSVRWADRTRDDSWTRTVAADWGAVITAAPLPHRLAFRIYNPGRDVFDHMRATGWLQQLRELDLAGDSQGGGYDEPGDITPLFTPGTLPRLVRLRLHEAGCPELLRAVAAWPGVRRLERLDLGDDYHGRLHPANFAPARPPVCLRELAGVIIASDDEADRFLALPGLERVRRLELSLAARLDHPEHYYDEDLTPAAAVRVVTSPRLVRLTHLSLMFAHLPSAEEAVIARLADPAVLAGLRRLDLSVHRDGGSGEWPAFDAVRARFGHRVAAH